LREGAEPKPARKAAGERAIPGKLQAVLAQGVSNPQGSEPHTREVANVRGNAQVVLVARVLEAHLYATSCDVLIQVELPDGWEGTCLERMVNGELELGVFPYSAVSD
jgi:hypothetical protein